MDQDNLVSYAHTAEEWTSYVYQNGLFPLLRYNSMKQTIESQTITTPVRLKASRDFELRFTLTEKLVTHLHRYNSQVWWLWTPLSSLCPDKFRLVELASCMVSCAADISLKICVNIVSYSPELASTS